MITNENNLPEAIVQAITNINQEYSGKSSYVSASSITLPPRIFHLKKRYGDKVNQDASDLIWSLVGTLMHSLLEKGAKGLRTEIVEQRLYKEIEGRLFSGQFDNFEFENGILTDFKFTTIYSLSKDVKFEYIAQGNCLRLLLNEAGYNVKEIQIVYIFRDWSKIQADFKPDYPKHQVQKIKVPLWTLEETEQFLIDKIKLLKSHEDTPDDALPLCTKEDKWQDSDIWAVKKKGQKRALKLYDIEMEAKIHLAKLPDGEIEFRPSIPKRCQSYCEINQFCNQYLEENKNADKKR